MTDRAAEVPDSWRIPLACGHAVAVPENALPAAVLATVLHHHPDCEATVPGPSVPDERTRSWVAPWGADRG